jgi:hypothetical protein
VSFELLALPITHVEYFRALARALKGKGRQILLNRNLFHALMGTLNLEMHVKHHFQVNVYHASTGLLAGELFYNAMCVFFSLMHAKSADPPFSDNVKNTMNSICLFKWFTEITLCPKEC